MTLRIAALSLLTTLTSSLVFSCSSTTNDAPKDEALVGELQCDNIDEKACTFPFPSDYFRKVEGGKATVTFGPKALPKSTEDEYIDPSAYSENDGFPVVTPITFTLPGATLADAPSHATIDSSLNKASKTIIIDAETGEFQAHWAEFDYFAEDEGQKVITLRLARPLGYGKRYIVATAGLAGGTASRGFLALRDKTKSLVRGIEERRARFEAEVFPALSKAGIARETLQIAWDFTTATEKGSTDLLVNMRDKMLEAIGKDGPTYTIASSEERKDGPIARVVKGKAKIPSFLLPADKDGIRRVRLDSAGIPKAEGFETLDFDLQFPRSATVDKPASVLQYGHGFLGGRAEAASGYLQEMANTYNFVISAVDYQGMNTEAGLNWFVIFRNKVARVPHLSEAAMQGAVNQIAIQRMMKSRLFADKDPRLTVSDKPIYDPSKMFYYGNSQGGTQGNLVMSLSVDVTRGVLGVPGCCFGFLLPRASQWKSLAENIRLRFPDVYDFISIQNLGELGWNKLEPINFIRRVTENPFPGTPSHRVLLHVALEDAQVNNQVSEILGRTINAKLIQPAVKPVWGFSPLTPPSTEGNAYAEYDFGVPTNPKPNHPANPLTDTHESLRNNKAGQKQMMEFLYSGTFTHTCEGPCVFKKP